MTLPMSLVPSTAVDRRSASIHPVLASIFSLVLVADSVLCGRLAAAEPEMVNVWPGKPPGETKELPPESNTTKPEDKPVGDRPIIKLGNVSTPTLAIYRPAKEADTGAAVIICPGGGHHILAYETPRNAGGPPSKTPSGR